MKKILLTGITLGLFGIASAAEYNNYADAFNAGSNAHKAKNYQTMRSAFEQAKKLAKTDGEKWNALFFEIKALREMKKWDDSLKLLDDYLAEKNPERFKFAMIFVKGLVFNSKGDPAKGAALIEEALKCPELFGYMKEQAQNILINYYYQQKDYDKCAARAETVISEGKSGKPAVDSARFFLAQCRYDQKKYEECRKLVKEFTPIVEAASLKSRMAYLQAQLHRLNSEYEDAIRQFELSIKYEPNGWRAADAKRFIKKLQEQ